MAADGERTSSTFARGNSTLLGAARQEWPTPTVSGNHNRKGASPESGDGLATAVQERQLWATATATATARDSRSGKASAETHARNARPLSEQVGLDAATRWSTATDAERLQAICDLLNPDWVELLMGFPSGWTAGVPAVAKPSTQRSRRAPLPDGGETELPSG